MTILPERSAALLLDGARITGTMMGGYEYAWERLYVDEAEELKRFCQWIDDEVGGCSEYNIYELFQAWKHPEDAPLQAFVAELKARIAEINEMIKK